MATRRGNPSSVRNAGKLEVKTKLSTLWIFAVFNYLYAYLYADVNTLMDPEGLKIIMSGSLGSIYISQWFLLGAAILMETAIVMVFLSRILEYQADRRANVAAGVIHTAAVSLSMSTSTPAPFPIFFGAIEIACTLYIIWVALRWKPEAAPACQAV
jgi:hypothetical protein